MSKFAAIEARCTKYPASTNDVVWLVSHVRELREDIVEALDYLVDHRDVGSEGADWKSPELQALIVRLRDAVSS